MYKKILLIFISCLFLVGCGNSQIESIDKDTINYNLDISKTFKEKIIFSFDNNREYVVEDDFDAEYDDFVTKITNYDIYSLYYEPDKYYNKVINKNKDVTNVELNYEYVEDEFVYPNIIMSCFESYEINSKEDYFEMNLMGEFSCLDNIDRVDINVSSDYEVLDTNGELIDNKYHWVIDNSNVDFTYIKFKISRNYNDMLDTPINNKSDGVFAGIIKIVVLLFGMFILYKLYLKLKGRIGIE